MYMVMQPVDLGHENSNPQFYLSLHFVFNQIWTRYDEREEILKRRE